MPQLLLDAHPAGKQALLEGKASDDVACQRKLCIASASFGRLAGVTNFDFLPCRAVPNISGQPQALALAGFCATWLSHCRKQAKTVQHAAAALKRIVKEDTKTKTASTRDLWGVIIRAPIQQFRWKFWKPVNRPESP